MVYITGDDLNDYAAQDINEMEAAAGQDYRRAYQSLVNNPGAVTAAQVAAGMVTAFGA